MPRPEVPYSRRVDGIGRPVPNIVYKVPTAGGKTFLAVASLSRIFHRYLGKSTGFVLWIVPNEAIYTQTKRYLSNKEHPYRQLLNTLSGNAVKIMEKTTPLHAADVGANLCVMLLMLQSSNRQKQRISENFSGPGRCCMALRRRKAISWRTARPRKLYRTLMCAIWPTRSIPGHPYGILWATPSG